MTRLIASLLAVLASWLGLAVPAAAGDVAMSSLAVAYTYNSAHDSTASTGTASERGPPVRGYSAIAHDAVGLGSSGALARLEVASPGPTTTYAMRAQFGRITRATGTSQVPAQVADAGLAVPRRVDVATKTATGAESALSGARLNTHLRQLEKYGQGGFRELESGRFRYYGNLSPAAKEGDMVGRRLVREWDPVSGATRTWHETIDRSGNIRIVRPETGGPKTHYYFDEFGNYGGSW